MSHKIFSGKNSQKFWDAVNNSMNDILCNYGCKAQELEKQRDDLLERLEKTTKYLEIRTKKQSKYSIPRLVDTIIEANKVAVAKAKKVRE